MRKMKHTKRVFILIPRSMLTELFEKTRIKITTDPYIPDYGLVESVQVRLRTHGFCSVTWLGSHASRI